MIFIKAAIALIEITEITAENEGWVLVVIGKTDQERKCPKQFRTVTGMYILGLWHCIWVFVMRRG